MYRFMDRPVLDLAPGEQMLIWSMRHWVGAMALRRCPCAVLGPLFERWRVAELLAGFNMTMFLLNAEGEGPLRFGPHSCGMVHDDEAMLLALFHAAADNDDALVRRLAAQVVKAEALPPFLVAIGESADVLRRIPVARTTD
jgi:hypothetical protein